MATISKQYLDLQGLTTYDRQIKELIPAADEVTLTLDSNGILKIKNPPRVENGVLKLS